jgi:hypothetical protein
MLTRQFSFVASLIVPVFVVSIVGCGGTEPTPPPVPDAAAKAAPADAPFGGLGNPFNEPEKAKAKKK